ncbi:HAD family hydrolase [Thermithiobacillus plumbiphilus]|uniref:HAD family hydrolase n=1 Tax=Thermithiobacillus plumbiphilus TaxID=1729899 RepID=A0ABU9DA49_9PROT
MTLALFDLDNTLLTGDSDHAWCEFLIEQGVLDGDSFRARNEQFYADYLAGTLDIHAFLDFQLRPLADNPPEALNRWHADFMASCIEPMITPAARALIAQHRELGHELVIITATNRFVTGPIARALGIQHLIATEPAMEDGRYTGKVEGTPCFREGKITRLEAWLANTRHSLEGSYFYSDSHNDLPLLQRVEHPFAVNPDDKLRAHAQAAGWPILDLRGERIQRVG